MDLKRVINYCQNYTAREGGCKAGMFSLADNCPFWEKYVTDQKLTEEIGSCLFSGPPHHWNFEKINEVLDGLRMR